MITQEDWQHYRYIKEHAKNLEASMVKRACEIYLRYYEMARVADPDFVTWETGWLRDVALYETGHSEKLDSKLTRATFSYEDYNGLTYWYIDAELYHGGETSYLHFTCDNIQVLFDDSVADKWIEDSRLQLISQKEAKEAEIEKKKEDKDRAEYERLKAKFEPKEQQ